MSKKQNNHKHVKVREAAHAIFKDEAKRKGKTMMDYMDALSKRVKAAAVAAGIIALLMGCRAGDSTAPSEGRDSTVIYPTLGRVK